MPSQKDLQEILQGIIDKTEKEHIAKDGSLDWNIARRVNKLIDIVDRLRSGYYSNIITRVSDVNVLLRDDLKAVGFEETEAIAKQVESGEFYE